jgi:SAM-dependent methyltransferase
MTASDLCHQAGLCPLCGGALRDDLLTITQPDRFELAVGVEAAGYRRVWRECGGCGAAINQNDVDVTRKLQAVAKNYYEIDLGSSIGAKYQRVMNLPEAQSDNAGRTRRVIEKYLDLRKKQKWPQSDAIRVADVGAGTGVFLAKARQVCAEKGVTLEAVAIEPDPIAAAHLRTLGIARVYEGLLDEKFSETEFDLVTCNKVIEHIEDPVPALEQGRRILNERGGLIYVEVPDVQTVRHRPATDNILGALHHHLFDLNSLDRLFRRAGLVPVDIQRIVDPSGKLTVFGFAMSPRRYQLLASRT